MAPRKRKITPKPHIHAPLAPEKNVITTLEPIIAAAKEGRIIGVAIAYVENTHALGTASGARADATSINLLKAAIHDLHHELQHAVRRT